MQKKNRYDNTDSSYPADTYFWTGLHRDAAGWTWSSDATYNEDIQTLVNIVHPMPEEELVTGFLYGADSINAVSPNSYEAYPLCQRTTQGTLILVVSV